MRYLLIGTAVATSIFSSTVMASPINKKNPQHSNRVDATTHHIIPEAGTLNREDVIYLLKGAAADSNDQFTSDPLEKYIGREVSVELGGNMTVNYDKSSNYLKIVLNPMQFLLLTEQFDKGIKEGMNSYGAKFKYDEKYTYRYGLINDVDISVIGNTEAVYSIKLDGEKARELSKALKVKITGVIEKRSPASYDLFTTPEIMQKHSFGSAATVQDPIDSRGSYFYGLHIKPAEVSLLDGNGVPIFVWHPQ
jgi:hypothetical protein